MIARALGLALLVAAGCSPVANRCQDGTLLVAVTLDEASAAADQFTVTISIDGVASSPSTIARGSATAAGNIVVQFPHGYPRGHTISVAVDALVAGAVVGSGAGAQPLAGGCEVLSLRIAATQPGDDLGAGDDLAAADLAPPPPDMVCVPTAETGAACFDGIDNDCDGDTDCADSDCAAGAQCVPAVSPGFTLGITAPQASFCPALFSSKLAVLNQGLSAASPACDTSACTCTPSINCGTSVTAYEGPGCNGNSDDNSAGATCRGFTTSAPTQGLTLDMPIMKIGASCGPGGTSARSSTSWTTQSRFCQSDGVGGGCTAGNVCVPKLSVPTCEVADGTVTCDPGYNAMGSWYTGSSDTRVCQCACDPASGGSCGTTVAVYTTNNCTGSAVSPNNCSLNATYHSILIPGCANPTCPGKSASVIGGTLMGTGPQTLCCRP